MSLVPAWTKAAAVLGLRLQLLTAKALCGDAMSAELFTEYLREISRIEAMKS